MIITKKPVLNPESVDQVYPVESLEVEVNPTYCWFPENDPWQLMQAEQFRQIMFRICEAMAVSSLGGLNLIPDLYKGTPRKHIPHTHPIAAKFSFEHSKRNGMPYLQVGIRETEGNYLSTFIEGFVYDFFNENKKGYILVPCILTTNESIDVAIVEIAIVDFL